MSLMTPPLAGAAEPLDGNTSAIPATAIAANTTFRIENPLVRLDGYRAKPFYLYHKIVRRQAVTSKMMNANKFVPRPPPINRFFDGKRAP
jgi:hypothetical protein